jgi:hypothetical protein
VDDLWIVLHTIKSLSDNCHDFDEYSSNCTHNATSISVDEANGRKLTAKNLYQQWIEARQLPNETLSIMKNLCYDTRKSLAKSLYISDDIPQCKEGEPCQWWLNMLSQLVITVPDVPIADVDTSNLVHLQISYLACIGQVALLAAS